MVERLKEGLRLGASSLGPISLRATLTVLSVGAYFPIYHSKIYPRRRFTGFIGKSDEMEYWEPGHGMSLLKQCFWVHNIISLARNKFEPSFRHYRSIQTTTTYIATKKVSLKAHSFEVNEGAPFSYLFDEAQPLSKESKVSRGECHTTKYQISEALARDDVIIASQFFGSSASHN